MHPKPYDPARDVNHDPYMERMQRESRKVGYEFHGLAFSRKVCSILYILLGFYIPIYNGRKEITSILRLSLDNRGTPFFLTGELKQL